MWQGEEAENKEEKTKKETKSSETGHPVDENCNPITGWHTTEQFLSHTSFKKEKRERVPPYHPNPHEKGLPAKVE